VCGSRVVECLHFSTTFCMKVDKKLLGTVLGRCVSSNIIAYLRAVHVCVNRKFMMFFGLYFEP